MNWYMDVFGSFWGVFIPLLSLLIVSIFWYRQENKRFREWQFMTVGISSRARYEALKTPKSLLIRRSK